jgi:hypothetical protein
MVMSSLGLIGVAVVSGLLIGSGNLLLLAPIGVIAGLALILMLPVTWTIWALIVCAMLVVGPAVYFAKIGAARLVTPVLALALTIPLLVQIVGRPNAQHTSHQTPTMYWWLGLFLLSVVFSTAIDDPRLGELLNAPRYYLVGVPLILLLAKGALDEQGFERMFRFLLYVGLAQLPVALVQYFVFAARKVKSAEWDAVIGTFPGNAEGGGASAGMGVFLLTAFVIALCLWRRDQLKTRMVVAVTGACILTVAIAEVKAVVLLIPVAAGLVYFGEVRRHPWQSLLAVLLSVVLMGALLTVYSKLHYADQANSLNASNAPRSPLEAIKNQFDPEREGKWTNTMGRVAGFVDWWNQNAGRGDAPHALFGYGASATQANNVGVGELVPRYRYPLDQTSTGMLLWETGLVGHALLVVALLVAALTANRLSKRQDIPVVHQALLHAAGVALALHVLTLPYKSFVFTTAPNQVLLALLLGYVAFWAGRSAPQREAGRKFGSVGAGTGKSHLGHVPPAAAGNAAFAMTSTPPSVHVQRPAATWIGSQR